MIEDLLFSHCKDTTPFLVVIKDSKRDRKVAALPSSELFFMPAVRRGTGHSLNDILYSLDVNSRLTFVDLDSS